MKFDGCDILLLRRMTYDIKKPVVKKRVLQIYDFLFVWNLNLIIYKVNVLFVIISVENRIFIQMKNLI